QFAGATYRRASGPVWLGWPRNPQTTARLGANFADRGCPTLAPLRKLRSVRNCRYPPHQMRFLYGDSTPFPLGYNFLATLESFMSAATRMVLLDLEGSQVGKQRDELAQNRVKGLEALEQFHNVVMRAVQDTAAKVQHQHALEYARAVAEYATHYIEEHRRNTLAANEREHLQLRGEGDRRATEMRSHLETFLKVARLPVL